MVTRLRRNVTELRLSSVWPLVRQPRTLRSHKIKMSRGMRPDRYLQDLTFAERLRDRIGALSGTMDIISPASSGTVLRASIPFPSEPA